MRIDRKCCKSIWLKVNK